MAIAALVAGSTANAKSDRVVIPKSTHLTLKQTIKWQHRIIRHDRWVIRTAKVHHPKVVRWHRAQLRWVRKELKESLSALSTLQHRYLHSSVATSSICYSCWDKVSECEDNDDPRNGPTGWASNTGNGFYGGLQFMTSTWLNAGGGKYASRADYATREQQIAIASKLSLSNWPVCGARY